MLKSLVFLLGFGLVRFGNLMQGKGYGAKTTPQEVKVISNYIKSGEHGLLMVDVGGNVGDYSACLRKYFSHAEIHIFEPAMVNITKLEARFLHDKAIHISPFGLSNQCERLSLYSELSGSGLGSLSNRRLDHFNINFDVVEPIEVIRFEDYWHSGLGERDIDLIKLDIEGHELDALKGFGNALAKIKIIQFEFGGCNLDTKTSFQDFYYFFKEAGFSLSRITPFGAQPIKKYRELDEVYLTTNYMAINERFK